VTRRIDVTELFEHMQPTAAAVRRHWPDPKGDEILTLLATGAFHVAAAGLGARMYERAKTPGNSALFEHLDEDHTTVEVAAMNLVTRGAVSAVDVACAALARVCGAMTGPLSPSTREKDCKTLDRAKLAKYPDLVAWLDAICRDPDWIELDEIRNQVTHRWWRRDINIAAPDPLSTPFAASRIDVHVGTRPPVALESALARWYLVGLNGWRGCCDALVAALP
jgi:hypothetical protein